MGTNKKQRHKLTVADRLYLWYVKQDEDSDSYILHVISNDKRFIVHYHLQQQQSYRYIIVLGKEFERVAGTGNGWRRFRCPAWENDKAITPSAVKKLIEWSQQANVTTEEVDYVGRPIPPRE
jgi:hypothetical protein